MRINTNIAAKQIENSLYSASRMQSRSLEKLSTGLRINRASDDAAGLAVSENLRAQVRGSVQARKNAMDGISLLNIADGGANEITSMIQRMRELAVQSANDTLTSNERSYLQTEYGQLETEIDRIAENTKYNNQSLLSGTTGFGVTDNDYLHIGAGDDTNNGIHVSIGRLQTSDIGIADEILDGTLSFTGAFGNQGSVSFSIDFDGTGNARGILSSTNGGVGSYIAADVGTEVTGINFYDEDWNTLSVKEMLTDTSKVAYISSDFAGDKTTTNIVNRFNDFGWSQWRSSGVSYSPSGNANSNGTTMRSSTNISSQKGAADAIFLLDGALQKTSRVRGDIGAHINRLNHTVNSLLNSEINLQAADSQIRDVDFAEETAHLSRAQILSQSSLAMLSQARTAPQTILSLLR